MTGDGLFGSMGMGDILSTLKASHIQSKVVCWTVVRGWIKPDHLNVQFESSIRNLV